MNTLYNYKQSKYILKCDYYETWHTFASVFHFTISFETFITLTGVTSLGIGATSEVVASVSSQFTFVNV